MKKLKKWYFKKDSGERARFISTIIASITILLLYIILVVGIIICIDNIVGKIIACVSITIIYFFAILYY